MVGNVPGSGHFARTLAQTQAAQDAVLALTDFFRAAVTERRRRKGSDLISFRDAAIRRA
jgi:hypothetical protein